jgi:hypothetical protein
MRIDYIRSDVYVLRPKDDERYWIADLLNCWESMVELSCLTLIGMSTDHNTYTWLT